MPPAVCSLHLFLRNFVRMSLFSLLSLQGPPPLDRAGQILCHLQVSLLQPQPASQGTSAGARWGRASGSPVTPWPGVLGEEGWWTASLCLAANPSFSSHSFHPLMHCSTKDPEERPDSRRSPSPGPGGHLRAAAVTQGAP